LQTLRYGTFAAAENLMNYVYVNGKARNPAFEIGRKIGIFAA